MPLSRSQIAVLHVAKKKLALDDDSYRAVLRNYGGADSAADLSFEGFANVMRRMTALGFKSEWTKRTFGVRLGMASPAQVDYIRDLWQKFHGVDEKEAALSAWLRRFHKVDALRFLDAKKAGSVITALKSMSARAPLQDSKRFKGS
jgi:phage gp16-like protein